MLKHNPEILTGADLITATDHMIMISLYQIIVASILITFASVIFYFIFKTLVWFLPKYWHKSKENM